MDSSLLKLLLTFLNLWLTTLFSCLKCTSTSVLHNLTLHRLLGFLMFLNFLFVYKLTYSPFLLFNDLPRECHRTCSCWERKSCESSWLPRWRRPRRRCCCKTSAPGQCQCQWWAFAVCCCSSLIYYHHHYLHLLLHYRIDEKRKKMILDSRRNDQNWPPGGWRICLASPTARPCSALSSAIARDESRDHWPGW